MGSRINDDRLHFAFTVDEKQIDLAAIAAISIFRRIQGILHIHILGDRILDATKLRVSTILDSEKGTNVFTIHDVDSNILCEGLPTKHPLTLATYLRLFLPELLGNIDKVVYLDADILVLQKCSTYDFLIDFSEPVAAVPDKHLAPLYNTRRGTKFEPKDTFNAGVMIMNLKYMREIGLGNTIIAWLKEYAETVWNFDQEGLNMILQGKYFRLPEKYNALKKTEETPLIVHYSGSKRKPNTYGGTLLNTSYSRSTIPWLLFRETTPLKIGKVRMGLLLGGQLVGFLARSLISQPLKRIRSMKIIKDNG